MSKNSDLLIFNEFRNRINDLQKINNSGPLFREVSRIVEWLDALSLFKQPLLFLDLQKRQKDRESLVILKKIYDEGKEIWQKIKTVPFDLEKIPENIGHSLAMLRQYYELGNPHYSISVYHNLRILVEYIASTPESKKIDEHFDKNNELNFPLLKGQIHDHYLTYAREEDAVKKEIATSIWGAWDNLRFVNYLVIRNNDLPKIGDWDKMFTKEDYFVYLHKVLNHIFDWIFLNKKTKIGKDDPLLDFAVWDDSFKFEDNVAKFGIYGEVKFYPEKSPSKLNNDNKPTSTQLILENVFKSKDIGIDKKALSTNTGVPTRDMQAFLKSINGVFENAHKKGKLQANAYISSVGDKIRLLVVPIEKENESELSP